MKIYKKSNIYKRIIVSSLAFGMILTSMPKYCLASDDTNKYYNEISNIQTKEDLQKSAQKAVRNGEIDTWIEDLENMPTARNNLTSAVVDSKIYCIGGYNSSSRLNTVEVYDPATNSWETKTSMPTARSSLVSEVVDGKIYCIGGYNGSLCLNTVEVYDPKTDSWETKTSMPTSRSSLASEVVNGKIYCIGGSLSSAYDSSTNIVEVYDPATDSWETKTSMPTSRDYLTATIINNKIYCIGGFNYRYICLNKVEVYDPATDSWETKTSMPTSRDGLMSAVVDGKIYCIGGYNTSDNYLSMVETYNPETNSWETKTSMPTNRRGATSTVVDGKIYCIGGYNDLGKFLNTVEAYTATIPKAELEIAEEAVANAESTKDPVDIENARDLVNQLPESLEKNNLQDRINAISPDSFLDLLNASANLDVYIECENMISLSLDTNSVNFDGYSGTEPMENLNAVNITISSSLPYSLNAYMPTEIQNNDGGNTIELSVFNIKESSEGEYKQFANTVNKIILKDNCANGNGNTHAIDLKLDNSNAHKADVYKTVIKFEVEQK